MYAQPGMVNYLRKLLEAGEITPEDFANAQSGGSSISMADPSEGMDLGAPPDFSNVRGGSSTNVLAQMLRPQEQGVPEVMPPATPIEQPAQRWQSTPAQMEAPPPMNSMRIESGPRAGQVISLDFGNKSDPMSDLQADFSQPIEIAGVGKGYWEKGGTGNAIVNGKRVMLGVDRNATNKRQAQEIALAQGRQNLDKGQVDMMRDWESIMSSRAQRSVREDPNSQAVLEKRNGKAPEGMRWKPDGTLEPMPGNKKEQQGKQVLQLLDVAEPLIAGSTGSGAGALADDFAGFFGKSTKGGEAIARLQAISGQLVAMQPRMEGPQSNLDVVLYRQMAGDLANPKLPVERRQAAAKTIRDLNAKYADNPQGSNGQASAAPPAGSRVRGQVYQTPRGPMKWTGQGWLPAN